MTVRRIVVTAFIVAALALPGAASGEALHSQLRLGAGWYASPGSGVGIGGFEVGSAFLVKIAEYGLLGPSLFYTGLTGEAALQDLPNYANQDPLTKLTIHQFRLGVKGLFNPAQKMNKVKYLWPYGGIDIGLSLQYVTDRGGTTVSVGDGSADLYLKPTLGVLFYPRVPFTAYVEFGYNFIPTYKFMDKKFNLYGAPTPIPVDLNTDGFVLEAGLSYEF